MEKITRNYKVLYKRARQQAKDYRKMTESLAFYVGIIQPFATLPQLWTLYSTRQAAGLSLFTWVSYTIGASIFLVYGLIHKLKPIYYPQMLWISMQIAIIIGIIKYG